MRIAVITAMAEETLPILNGLGRVVAKDVIAAVKIYQIETDKHTIYLATTGIGEVRAAMAVQLLVDLFDIELVMNFGFVGAISHSLEVSELVLAERVCHHQFDITAVNPTKLGQYDGKDDEYFYLDRKLIDKVRAAVKKPIRLVTVASGDKFIAKTDDKDFLRATFGADICEMELSGLALACERNGVPLLSVKVVSDKADENATVSFGEVLERGLTKYEEILPDILDALDGESKPLPPVAANSKNIV